MSLDGYPGDAVILRMKAEREARHALARPEQSTAVRPLSASRPELEDRPAIQWPVRLLLPWSYLVSDNVRHGVINGKLLLTVAYRRAKGLTRDLAKMKLGDVEPAAFPLALDARVWVPDDMRAHDVCNFAKAVHDALESVVYTKDRWLYRVTWERMGVDVDHPRCELRITPLAPPPLP